MKHSAGRAALYLATILLLISSLGCTRSLQPTAFTPPATFSSPQQTTPTNTTTVSEQATATFVPSVVASPTLTSTPPPIETNTPTSTTQEPIVSAPENLSAGDPYSPELGNRGYDAEHYTLTLTLMTTEPALIASVSIAGVSTAEMLQQISLDFIGFEIDSITVNGIPADYFRQETKLIIQLAEPLPSGAPFELEIAYHGSPTREPSQYVPFIPYLGLIYPDGKNQLFVVAEPDGARYWYPVNDHPRDKASYRFELTVPQGLVGIANGMLVETQTGVRNAYPNGADGDLYIWEHPYPMASAFVTIAAGEYVRIESTSPAGIPLRHYAFAEEEESFESKQALIGEMIDWLSEQLGPYPFEAFGFVSTSILGASLETQTMVILAESGIHNEWELAHELAHMWFGDWVSLDTWGQMWRSEGIATYLANMWMTRDDPAMLDEQMDELAQTIAASPRTYPLDNPPRAELFGRDSYFKGALLVHGLRKSMGDEAFFNGLRAYLDQYGGGTATDADFQTVMEATAGFSLEEIFVEWFR